MNTVNQTGVSIEASAADSILAIIPVKVKAKKDNKAVTSYALLDPRSTATFCMGHLMNGLNIQGKDINNVLTTLGKQRSFPFMLSEVER